MENEKPFFSEKEPFFDEKVREKIKSFSEALRKDDKKSEEEKPKEEVIQTSPCVGYFFSSAQKDESVRKGQRIGFIKIKGVEKEIIIQAQSDGIITEILPNEKTHFAPKELREYYETKDEEGITHKEERILTSVEYGQALFTIAQK